MPADTRARPGAPRRSPSSWKVPVAVLAVAAVLLATIALVNRGEPAAPVVPSPTGAASVAPQQQGPDLSAAEGRDAADLLADGPVDAPVVLVVFSDYQCPYCARWSEQTLPAMRAHVAAGDLRIEWRDVNAFGPASERGARATHAAARQGALWAYHDALFEGGRTRTEAELSEEALIALAGDLGLQTDRFAADLRSEETAQAIAANQQLAFSLGATSTPVFLLGGRPLVGAQPTEVFEAAFAAALDAAA
ncbi:thioredoxin domain-containing protein [Propioniciclava coleopterorum]|uniref:Thioredoxin domain-containing protein n=1 Tax=Propioniciclava coleopterorum TaxID=2714937 RepID=A0A6G7Y3I0_9ACTN|nr:thioredoxin domain-containing protein [Propioniciclava coleopterorum]QIK71259.1 thioredoxin domain-containing protein [Propioniciclava coleopterorum]